MATTEHLRGRRADEADEREQPDERVGQAHRVEVDERQDQQQVEEGGGEQRARTRPEPQRGGEPQQHRPAARRPDSGPRCARRTTRHRPRSSSQERTGMLSRAAIGVSHAGQCDAGELRDSPRGNRQMTTLANDPNARPRTRHEYCEPRVRHRSLPSQAASNNSAHTSECPAFPVTCEKRRGRRSPAGLVPSGDRSGS